MSTRVIVPITRRCCNTNQFSDTFPSSLTGYCTPTEYAATIARINKANKPTAGPVIVHILCCLFYVHSIVMFLQSYGYGIAYYQQYDYEGDDLPTWVPFTALCVSSIFLVLSARWMRNKRIDALTKTISSESESYSQRQAAIAMRIINPGTRSASLEIDTLAASGIQIQEQQPGAAIQSSIPSSSPPQYYAPTVQPQQPVVQQHQLIAPTPHLPVYPSVQHSTGLLPSAPYVPFFSHPQPQMVYHPQQPSINAHYDMRQPLVAHQY